MKARVNRRETHEREAAFARAMNPRGVSDVTQAAAEPFAGMGHRLFTTLADNVRDYAVFLR